MNHSKSFFMASFYQFKPETVSSGRFWACAVLIYRPVLFEVGIDLARPLDRDPAISHRETCS
jgi:hypothetical protein